MLVQHLLNLKAKKIYEKRTVFSTYYDNDYFASYRNSEEGVTPRKKMRIRSYNSNQHSSNSMFESKISSEVDRFKKVEKFKNSSDVQNFLFKGFLIRHMVFANLQLMCPMKGNIILLKVAELLLIEK